MDKKIVMQFTTTVEKKKKFKEEAKKQGYTVSGILNKLMDDFIKKSGA